MEAIDPDLFEFLNEFGIFIENDQQTIYLKYRLFPTDDVRQRLQFRNDSIMIEDNFFDQFDSNKQQFTFVPDRFYRERSQANGRNEFVRQRSADINCNCHLYIEEHVDKNQMIQNERLQSFLNFRFLRSFSRLDENIYLDRLMIPQIEQPYEVISIKFKILDIQQIKEDVKRLFQIAFDFLPDEPLNKNYSQHLLKNNEKPMFPMYSKFMYALQMSEFYQSYSEFSKYDPIVETLETRLNIISKKTIHTPSYNKLWMWLMVYQVHYFQTRLDNFTNKSQRAPIAREIVEEQRKKIFGDESTSVELVEDEDEVGVVF
jgi:hypothetical protein